MGMFAELARGIKRRIWESNEQSSENEGKSPESDPKVSGITEAISTQQTATAQGSSSIYRCGQAAVKLSLLPEVREIQDDLERDYNRSVETLKFYDKLPDPANSAKLITAPLIRENPENPGTYFYEADYDGSAETIPDPTDLTKRIPNTDAVNFVGTKFTMPTCAEVLSWLTVDQVRLYNEMQVQGLEPKLQLSPIALNIRTIGRRIDAKRAELRINRQNTFVWDQIKDNELIYEADKFEAIEDGKKLKITGGKSKSHWINENNGWTIDIVATKEDLHENNDRILILTNPEKTEKLMKEFRAEGYSGLGYETFLTAQMDAVRRGKPLENGHWIATPCTVLPESSLYAQNNISIGYWSDGHFYLYACSADSKFDSFCIRRSVRVRRLKI